MRRGEIWTISGRGFAGKPRPAVVLQIDAFAALPSVTVCPFTTEPEDAGMLRLYVHPTPENGLRLPCRLMADKLITIDKAKAGERIGRLAPGDMKALEQALMVFLGLA